MTTPKRRSTSESREETPQGLAPTVRAGNEATGFGDHDPGFDPSVTCQADTPSAVTDGAVVILRARPADSTRYSYQWDVDLQGKLEGDSGNLNAPEVRWRITKMQPGSYFARVTIEEKGGGGVIGTASDSIQVVAPPVARGDIVPVDVGGSVSLRRAETQLSTDQALWVIIRDRTQAISFNRYKTFIDAVMCSGLLPDKQSYERRIESRLPFPGVAAYNVLKVATEFFLLQECGVTIDDANFSAIEEGSRFGRPVQLQRIKELRDEYLVDLTREQTQVLPYFKLILDRLSELPLKPPEALGPDCYGILPSRLSGPCLVELIWSYWHEEGMQAQAMNAISFRFQNKRIAPGRDPLDHFDLDPLRGLSNLLWGHVQDEQHRLSVVRRAYEYDHHYGLALYGKAVPQVKSVDSRSKFLEAFHNLLYRTSIFYKEDDDTTVIADGFEVLNALREVHLLLAHGAHNQFGDLPSTARQEMMIEQWLLARPEMREFLGGKIMVPYAEPWMDRVDTLKGLQGWTDTSITYFHDLAVYGEQLLLSIRYGNWSQINNAVSAANWARYWRPEVQRYVHAYRTVTGVDLTLDIMDVQGANERYVQPSVHLRNRLAMQGQQQSGRNMLEPGSPRKALGPREQSTPLDVPRSKVGAQKRNQ